MIICKVIKKTEGWNVGDLVELDQEQLTKLLESDTVEVVTELKFKSEEVTKHVSKSKSTTKGSNR